MSRRGDRLLLGASLALIVGAGLVLVEVFLLPPAQRNDVVGLGGFVLAWLVRSSPYFGGFGGCGARSTPGP